MEFKPVEYKMFLSKVEKHTLEEASEILLKLISAINEKKVSPFVAFNNDSGTHREYHLREIMDARGLITDMIDSVNTTIG